LLACLLGCLLVRFWFFKKRVQCFMSVYFSFVFLFVCSFGCLFVGLVCLLEKTNRFSERMDERTS